MKLNLITAIRNQLYFSPVNLFYAICFSVVFLVPNVYAVEDHHLHHKMMMSKANNYKRTIERYNLPEVKLLNENGAITSLSEEIKKLNGTVLLNFIFTSCTTICPIMSGTFSEANSKLDESNVKFISISIDPENDTPVALQKYANRFNARKNWTFLTGSLQDIVLVQKSFNAYRGSKMNHSPVTFLKNKSQSDWIRLDGFASTDDLVHEYKRIQIQ